MGKSTRRDGTEVTLSGFYGSGKLEAGLVVLDAGSGD
jgi:hypothetical protein